MKQPNYEDQESVIEKILHEEGKGHNAPPPESSEVNDRIRLQNTQEEVSKLRREMQRLKREQKVLGKLRHKEEKSKPAVQFVSPMDFSMPTISLGEYLATLVDSRALIAKTAFFFLLLGIGYLIIAEPIYQADALLETGAPVDMVSDIDTSSNVNLRWEQESKVNEQIQILQTRTLLSKVIDDLQLDITSQPVHFPVIGAAIARLNTLIKAQFGPTFDPDLPFVELNGFAWSNERIKIKTFDIPADYLGKIFTLAVKNERQYELWDEEGNLLSEGTVGVPNTHWLPDDRPHTLLVASIENAQPGKRFELSRMPQLDVIAQLRETLAISELGIGSGVVMISLEGSDKNKITAIVNDLATSFVAQERQKKSNSIGLSLDFMETQLPMFKQQAQKAEQALNDYRRQHSAFDLSRENQVLLERMVNIEAQLSELRRSRTESLAQFTPQSPKISAMDAQISALTKELKVLEAKVKTFPDTEREILSLSKDAELYSQLYAFLRNRVGQLKLVQEAPRDHISVVDLAIPPLEPIKPQKAAVIIICLVLGGLFGIGAAFLKKALRGAIQDPSAIEKQLGLHVYATIPHSLEQHKLLKSQEETKKAVLAVAESTDPAIESVRSLRTSLHFDLLESANNVILITGPTPGVGKSFLTVNLGAVLASAGKRVLIIDADLRKGRLNKHFDKDSKEGLADIIANGHPIEQVIRKTYVDQLDIICTGSVPPNPSELLAHERFPMVIEKLSALYDYVIIDSPPVLLVTDAVIIGQLAGATMLVVKAGVNTVREIEQSSKRLEMAGVNLRGVVFNDMPISKNRYGYGDYYGYAYTYAYKK